MHDFANGVLNRYVFVYFFLFLIFLLASFVKIRYTEYINPNHILENKYKEVRLCPMLYFIQLS